ncbi:hypothetical protein LO762_13750 [Actinocorallia sp. API 0066]|uniref:hypothetical protein n=1 Tax=Actinocorallia sp. API 0066 TaxID=2896846 RepID=UPI001E61E736|nr:hypothetical protein [Actinocorallia sp. API 0066]MCD0450248.1 hypothetical protein [Actinocorallia sp. API 0066]
MRLTVVVSAALAGVLLVPQGAAAKPSWKNVTAKAFKTSGTLLAVAAVNKRTVFAVNENGRPFHWNGKKWTVKKGAGTFRPTAIAASSPTRAWAVGLAGVTPVAIYWNGKSWKRVAYPGANLGPITLPLVPLSLSASPDGTVYSVAGLNAKNDGASAVRRWNGKRFVNVDVPAGGASLTAVAVRTKGDVWLAGTTTANGTQAVATVLRLQGGQWKQVPAPGGDWGTIGQPHNIIQDLAVAGPNRVWAIRAQNGGGLLRWTGSGWTEARTPLISHYALTPDGGSGAWTIPSPGTGGKRSQYLHWAGKWTTLKGPQRKGDTQIHDLVRVPGTRQVIAVGGVASGNKRLPVVEIYR